jgi:hypothetical protein
VMPLTDTFTPGIGCLSTDDVIRPETTIVFV